MHVDTYRWFCVWSQVPSPNCQTFVRYMIGDQYSTAEKSTGKRIFQVVVQSSVDAILWNSQGDIFLVWRNQSRGGWISGRGITSSWRTGKYKLNTNGSTKCNPGIGRFGGVFRNHTGDWILGYMKGILTPLLSELTSMHLSRASN